MLQELSSLANLPWATLLTLASGYAAYYVANLGNREHHRSIDVAFSTLVFGLIAAALYREQVATIGVKDPAASAIAFTVTALVGAAWGRVGRAALRRVFRGLRLTDSDDLADARHALSNQRRVIATQLTVRLVDGTWLKCNDLHQYRELPNGPCVIGRSGDLLIYVTHVKSHEDSDFVPCPQLIDGNWGAEISYIPAEQISRIDIRRRRL